MSTCTDMEIKRARGCAVERPMPDTIPDTPENIMPAVLNAPPKRNDAWRHPDADASQTA